jgi:HrpA-like RNA helicase
MSATVAAETYVDYFDVTDPPVFVGGRCYPIKEYYIEDIGAKLSFSSRETKATHAIKDKCLKMKCKVAPNAHYMASIQNLAVQVAIAVAKERSSVLIFVPGMSDIVAIVEDIENIVRPGIKYKCIAIHSDVPFEEQMTAFDALNTGEIKIIVATNAAESSLTLPDVDHVICTGLCKEIVYNATTHRQMLTCNWISKASATQRKGRTGRVREGNVYRLYPRTMYENDMSPFEIGEMHRMPLDSIILNLRSIVKEQNVTDMLAECLEPPNMSTIEKSIESLHQSRFIDEVRDDFEITALGNLVTCLGVDLKMGALIGIGKKLDVLPECIAIAAFLSFPQSPWLIPNSLLQPPATFNSKFSNVILL